MFEMPERHQERDVKLITTFTSLKPTRDMVYQHVLMVFKEMLEELQIIDIS